MYEIFSLCYLIEVWYPDDHLYRECKCLRISLTFYLGIFMNFEVNSTSEVYALAVAPLAWVPWVLRNPSNCEQWVPEPMNFEP